MPFKPWTTNCMCHRSSIQHVSGYVSPNLCACCSQPAWSSWGELQSWTTCALISSKGTYGDSEAKYHHWGKELSFYLHKFVSEVNVTNLSHVLNTLHPSLLSIYMIKDGNVYHVWLAFQTHPWCPPEAFHSWLNSCCQSRHKLSKKQMYLPWRLCIWMLLSLRLDLSTLWMSARWVGKEC